MASKKNLNYNYAFVFYDVNEKGCKRFLKYARDIYPIIKIRYSEEKCLHQS